MLEKILPEFLNGLIAAKLSYDKIYEIRMRAGKPLMINYGGRFYHIRAGSLTQENSESIICEKKLLEHVVMRASDHSIYTVTNQLREGFITVAGGIRIGICGEPVYENGEIRTFKNFSSLNIRVPHEVRNCALNALDFILTDQVLNTVVLSPPGGGKTTFIRDLTRLLSERTAKNILVLDERGEIAAAANGEPQLNVGKYTDVLTNCTKKYGFKSAVRTMCPDVIVTDELGHEEDVEAVIAAAYSGVKIIATAHAYDQSDYAARPEFARAVKCRLFERIVVLSARRGPGTYEGIYDAGLSALYYPR